MSKAVSCAVGGVAESVSAFVQFIVIVAVHAFRPPSCSVAVRGVHWCPTCILMPNLQHGPAR